MPYETLKVMKDNGLRLLLVSFESGSQQIQHKIKKGMRADWVRRFMQDFHKLCIIVYGTLMVGLPGETQDTIRETIRFAQEINPHTIQVSLAAAYPGTFLYRQATENGWLRANSQDMVASNGLQVSSLEYPHLSHDEIFTALEGFFISASIFVRAKSLRLLSRCCIVWK